MDLNRLAGFAYHDVLGGYAPGITRRDPSPVIRVGDTYYVWYSRTTTTHHGYTATVWYATSPDGFTWEERGQAVARGSRGAFDEHGVFTPSILVANEQYYLTYTGVPEPFYQGTGAQPTITKTAIGMAVADSPDGPWERLAEPILRPSDDPEAFDSLRTDDTCFVVRNEKFWMYYKGRGTDKTPGQTKMGVAIADTPTGPYTKVAENPVVDGGHEVCVWPCEDGVAGLFCDVGPAGNTLRWSADGVRWEKVRDLEPPKAPGPFREDDFRSDVPLQLSWGLSMVGVDWPYLQRFGVRWEDPD